MKRIKKDELYHNLGDFLNSKGISLGKGSYAQKIRQGCTLLTDAINVTEKGINRARKEVDRKLNQMKKVIKKKTGPKTAAPTGSAKKKATPKKKGAAKAPRKKSPPRGKKAAAKK